MPIRTTRLVAAGMLLTAWARCLAAQTDYRHLDGGRPLRVGDAYPLERYAFEISLPWSVSREAGATGHELAPHLEFGAARNLVIGVETDVRLGGGPGRALRLHRLETGLLWNLKRETPSLPALSLTASVAVPGAGGPAHGAVAVGLAATRSFAAYRTHFNAATRLVAPESAGGTVGPLWWAGVAVDRTLFRSSTLLVAELVTEREDPGAPLVWRAGAGARRQVAPTWVAYAGVNTGLESSHGFALNFGLSHLFGFADLMRWGAR